MGSRLCRKVPVKPDGYDERRTAPHPGTALPLAVTNQRQPAKLHTALCKHPSNYLPPLMSLQVMPVLAGTGALCFRKGCAYLTREPSLRRAQAGCLLRSSVKVAPVVFHGFQFI